MHNRLFLLIAPLIGIAFVGIPATADGQFVTVTVSAPQAPPAPRVVARPAHPRGNYVWVPGYWHWNEVQWVWVDGYWAAARPGYVVVEPRWVRERGRWVYRPGGWARRGSTRVVEQFHYPRVQRPGRVVRHDRRRNRVERRHDRRGGHVERRHGHRR